MGDINVFAAHLQGFGVGVGVGTMVLVKPELIYVVGIWALFAITLGYAIDRGARVERGAIYGDD